jgi:endoglucanase
LDLYVKNPKGEIVNYNHRTSNWGVSHVKDDRGRANTLSSEVFNVELEAMNCYATGNYEFHIQHYAGANVTSTITVYLDGEAVGGPLLNFTSVGIDRYAAVYPANQSRCNTTQAPSNLQWRGVSLAGAEFGVNIRGDGTFGNYIYPEVNSVDYFKNKGMNLVRLPFRWERLQPALNQSFDTAELSRLQNFVDGTTAKGVSVLLDPHNYAHYRGNVIGQNGISYAAFADFWARLATVFKNNPKVLFGLMNEPFEISTETWVSAANAAIQRIRATGATNTIMVPGNAWTGAHSWTQNGYGTSNAVAMKQISDPGNNIVFEVHQYLDSDSSGMKSDCVSANIGVERLKSFTDWLRANGKRGFLGEFAGANNTVCTQAVSTMLDYIETNKEVWAGWAWWAAGPWWDDYMFSIEPSNGTDKPQMSALMSHLR